MGPVVATCINNDEELDTATPKDIKLYVDMQYIQLSPQTCFLLADILGMELHLV